MTAQPLGSLNGASAPPSSVGGGKLLSLDLRTESSPGALVQSTEKKLGGQCSPKLEKSICYRIYIYYVLFDVVFCLFLKPQTFQNHSAGVRRVSN